MSPAKANYKASPKGIATALAYREVHREKQKAWREANKEKISNYNKNYLDSDEKIEKHKISAKKYYDINKEKLNEQSRIYQQTPEGIKKQRINKWVRQGIIDPDLSLVYDYLITQMNCMICDKVYLNSQDRQLDHDHTINDGDNIRYICCGLCNRFVVR
jgi:hypothetical protein